MSGIFSGQKIFYFKLTMNRDGNMIPSENSLYYLKLLHQIEISISKR